MKRRMGKAARNAIIEISLNDKIMSQLLLRNYVEIKLLGILWNFFLGKHCSSLREFFDYSRTHHALLLCFLLNKISCPLSAMHFAVW